MDQQQKEQFSQYLREYLNKNYSLNIQFENDTYKYLQTLSISEKRGIWTTIAQALQVTQLQVHDYFHNTWSKQFYTDIKEFKTQLENICCKQNLYLSDKTLVQLVSGIFKEQNKALNIHNKSLHQAINRCLQKIRKDNYKLSTKADYKNQKPLISQQNNDKLPIIKSSEDLSVQVSKVIQIQNCLHNNVIPRITSIQHQLQEPEKPQSRKPSAADLICFKDESLKQLDWQQFLNLM
ncbi:hypothetical protein SS50377_25596 [Spironucleus salmonicida]|uniref:Uncharacterized protein n=1 Tax=Spironucleus salmonicida TaxID=348837 RepID=V6LKN9_9EUKA|nr:hypothetical protein SS50377_25596 [Spironucleus salmonicida]|eukprot:EST45142.1 Hypothetical protein SS50377_15165 [Spironucleus salmonicida]